jgi:hypothetical protein
MVNRGLRPTVSPTGMRLIVEEKPICSLAKRPRLAGQCKAEADGDQRIFASMTRLIRRNMRISTLFLVNPQVAPKTPLGRIEPRRGT